MEQLRRAVEATEQIREALAVEVEQARHQRILIRKLDADGLFVRAEQRGRFNVALARMEEQLARHLAEAGAALGLGEVTLEAIRPRAPALAQQLGDRFAEVRALAAALHELDTLNKHLADRALACVGGYVHALTAKPEAYDRRGAATTGASLTTASRVA